MIKMKMIRNNCNIICTKLRNDGFDEFGILSNIPKKILIKHIENLNLDVNLYINFLLDYKYLENNINGYKLSGIDLYEI